MYKLAINFDLIYSHIKKQYVALLDLHLTIEVFLNPFAIESDTGWVHLPPFIS